MEASEAIRRIIWRRWRLLLILVIVPAVAVVAIQERHPVTYAATANVQGQGITPDTNTQVSAIQSRVSAIATDPATAAQAIVAAGVDRDPTQVARHEVAVTPLGTSAVMGLSVTDPSRPVAVLLAGALADVVVSQLNQLGIKDNPQLSALNKSIIELTAKRNALTAKLDSATATGVPSTSVQALSLLAQLSATEQLLSTAQATSQQLLTGLSANTGASVVSTPSTANEASRHALTYGALAGLLGLIVGLLFCALREMARPTVAQPAAGARELGTVTLGDAEMSRDAVTVIDDDLAGRLSLAAHRAGVDTIVLTGPVPHARLAALASRLNTDLTATAGESSGAAGWLRTPVPVRASGPAQYADDMMSAAAWHNHGPRHAADAANDGAGERADHPAANPDGWSRLTVVAQQDIRLGDRERDAALVVVLPEYAPHSSLDQAGDLCLATDWPVLGVIGLRRGRWRAKRAVSPKTLKARAGVDPAASDLARTERHDD